jgi:hypothetical protein
VKKGIQETFPWVTNVAIADVARQPDLDDCGTYSIANAVTFSLGGDPRKALYGNTPIDEPRNPTTSLRKHVWKIFKDGHLSPFPAQNRENVQDRRCTLIN